ncbi:MAG: hypothetical protein RJA70_1365 [Pseudomonadota bacterium]|jgi:hypothetical protein
MFATFDGAEYWVCHEPKSHSEAAESCLGRGLMLARIDSHAEDQFIKAQVRAQGLEQAWLGGSADGPAAPWRWADGEVYWTGAHGGYAPEGLFQGWRSSEPSIGGPRCLQLFHDDSARNGEDSATWTSAACSTLHPFVCEAYTPVARRCGDGVVQSGAGEACDDGGPSDTCSSNCQRLTPLGPECQTHFYLGHRYSHCARPETHADASDSCANAGLRLARLDGAGEVTRLISILAGPNSARTWVGGHARDDKSVWIWGDGEQFWQGASGGAPVGLYANFLGTEPNNLVAPEGCLELKDTTDYWNDQSCDTPNYFWCEDYRVTPPTCGNGVLDPYEGCDGDGQSADCDADCTIAVCGDGTVNLTAGEQCDPFGNPNCNGDCSLRQRALLVPDANSTHPSDRVIEDRLKLLGFTVDIIADDRVTLADVDSRALVVIADGGGQDDSSLDSVRNANTPMLVLEDGVFERWGLAGTVVTRTMSAITIVNPEHPLAASLTGLTPVLTASANLDTVTQLGTAALGIAVADREADEFTLFAYEANTPLRGQRGAVQRRVGMFLSFEALERLNPAGEALFDAAVRWVTAPPLPRLESCAALSEAFPTLPAHWYVVGRQAPVASLCP